ncbi:MAG: 16S rRNA (guanine(966)-N(2))-methyltransferase RsmD [Bacteroidetes bacterium HGW-Bacteroidetes-6]|jgi:16S rRNA (guanine(966)-N(2))-methyltransferase RsmD|nr:MAG: 16S rRNA (guanine(966)-N(2))-methyltransferase RsmD [Bacteroidetes bacterium HGW-Bacteroidetes-6]
MRIISGYLKGRTFSPPERDGVRPTTDMAKEGLFNILVHRFELEDAVVFDLFSGTGSIGFEFVSRGAKQVFCVEKDAVMATFIKSVAAKMQMENLTVLRSDAFKFLVLTTLQADIIFADPPYQNIGVSDIPELVFGKNILNQDGLLIVEHDQTQHFSGHPRFKELRKYGKVHFSLFQ